MNTREVTKKYRLNQWIEIIRECRNSGQTINRWCTEHAINPKSYYYWLKRVREAACEALPTLTSEGSSIVPVNTAGFMPADNTSATDQLSDIRLRIGTVTIEIRNSASATLIENTVRALHNVR